MEIEKLSDGKRDGKAYDKEYRAKNKERIKEYNREYCDKNKEWMKEYHKEYYANNKQRARERAKEYYSKNKESLIANARVWALAHPENIAKTRQKEKYKDEAKRRYEYYRDTLHDSYVRTSMSSRLGIKGSELPQILVDTHRELMKLKRELKK